MLLAQIDTCQSQAKAGVVQSSGIVSISSVPFGRYEVKLAADMKGQPATGSNQHLVSFSPPKPNIRLSSVSAQFNADDKSCRRICVPIPDRPLPGEKLLARFTVTLFSLIVRSSVVFHGDSDVEYGRKRQSADQFICP